MRDTIAAFAGHYNKNEATCDMQIAANHDAFGLSFACPFEVMSFERPTSTHVKTSMRVESAKTDGRLRECFVIDENE